MAAAGSVAHAAAASEASGGEGAHDAADWQWSRGAPRGPAVTAPAAKLIFLPGEQQHLKKAKVKEKRAARAAARSDGFDVQALHADMLRSLDEDDVEAADGGIYDILMTPPLPKEACKLVANLARLMQYTSSAKGGGQKRVMTLTALRTASGRRKQPNGGQLEAALTLLADWSRRLAADESTEILAKAGARTAAVAVLKKEKRRAHAAAQAADERLANSFTGAVDQEAAVLDRRASSHDAKKHGTRTGGSRSSSSIARAVTHTTGARFVPAASGSLVPYSSEHGGAFGPDGRRIDVLSPDDSQHDAAAAALVHSTKEGACGADSDGEDAYRDDSEGGASEDGETAASASADESSDVVEDRELPHDDETSDVASESDELVYPTRDLRFAEEEEEYEEEHAGLGVHHATPDAVVRMEPPVALALEQPVTDGTGEMPREAARCDSPLARPAFENAAPADGRRAAAQAREPAAALYVAPALRGDWERHTRGIGSLLLARMGYRGGALGPSTRSESSSLPPASDSSKTAVVSPPLVRPSLGAPFSPPTRGTSTPGSASPKTRGAHVKKDYSAKRLDAAARAAQRGETHTPDGRVIVHASSPMPEPIEAEQRKGRRGIGAA